MTRKRAGDIAAAGAVLCGIGLALFVYFNQGAEEADDEATEEYGRRLAAKHSSPEKPKPAGPAHYFTEGPTVACRTEEELRRARALMASGTDPEAGGAYLAAQGCTVIPGGEELTVTDGGVLTMEVFFRGRTYLIGTGTVRTVR